MKRICFFTLLIIISSSLHAQDKARGLSQPGSIGISRKPAAKPASPIVDVDVSVPYGPMRNPYAVAVIIGNGDYVHNDIPDVAVSINDAVTMRKYLVSTFGYREENIIFIKNGTKTDFETLFGTKDVPEGKLYNYIKPNRSDAFVYYSGHGAPDPASKKAYFMPVDCDPSVNLKIGGYPLETFYQNLEKLPAKSITVVIDACFSGGSQQGNIIKYASPMFIDVQYPMTGEKCSVFTSASGDQISSWYPEARHSLFTYYFLRAIRGEADKDKNRRITVREIRDFIDENVPYMARRKYGREQTPVVKGNLEAVISTY